MKEYSRPEFMILLDLQPPCTVSDVKQAFRARVRQAHPDHGADQATFIALHEAYEEGLEYAQATASRMDWLADHVEKYIRRIAATERIEQAGGSVDLREVPWITRSCGKDYSQMADKLVGLHLSIPEVADETLELLVDECDALAHVEYLNLADSNITDVGMDRLKVLVNLRHLDIRNTPVTARGLRVLQELESLRTLWTEGVPLGWLARRKLAKTFPMLDVRTNGESSRRLLAQSRISMQ